MPSPTNPGPGPMATQPLRPAQTLPARNLPTIRQITSYPKVMSSPASGQPQSQTRLFLWSLLCIVLVSLLPRLLIGFNQFVEYDGYLHVWIAQQDRWANFIGEYRADAHPPLYYLLLRASLVLGHSQMAYRSLSLVSGIASVWLLGITALKALRSPLWAALAALAYGIAIPSINLSNEVRAYMLSACFVQISFYCFLDLIDERQPTSLRPRIVFGVMAVLACLTEYYALIYVGAVLLFAFALPILRRGEGMFRALLRETVTFILVLALPVAEYINHLGAASVAYNHLPGFYFNPESTESVVDFLLRNLRNEFNCFSPIPIKDDDLFSGVLVVLLVILAATIFLLVRRSASPVFAPDGLRDPRNLAALVSLLLPLVMLCALMVGGVIRAYPFGGFLRQQYILFPFLVVCPFLLLDRLLSGSPRALSLAVAGVLATGIVIVSVRNYQAWPKISRQISEDRTDRYARLFPAPESVYLDQFSLPTFFTFRHYWDWQYQGAVPGHPSLDVYKVSRDNHSLIAFRDKDRWNLDFREEALYSQMADAMNANHLSSLTVFCPAQTPGPARTRERLAAYRDHVAELAAAKNLCVQTMDVANYDVYAEFRQAGKCTAQETEN